MFRLYRIICFLLTPLYGFLALYRLIKGKEERAAIKQRFGSFDRFMLPDDGFVIWVHAASVGEVLSAITFIEFMHKRHPNIHFVVTTYTKTAAASVKKRALSYVTHAYIPYDHPLFIARFLKRCRPKAVFWIESELWPEALFQIKKNKIPAFLLNMRMSQRSATRWQTYAPQFARKLLSAFTYVQAQTEEYGSYYESVMAKKPARIGNIKNAAAALSYNKSELAKLQEIWRGRRLVLFASTHKGEEDIFLNAAYRLKSDMPDLLPIIVPRHPERGESIARLARKAGFPAVNRRSENAPIKTPHTDAYIADTLGELGLFYKLCPVVVIGNSFVHDPGGGHNPLEPAHLGCCIIYGPSMYNFQTMHEELQSQNAAIQVNDEEALTKTLRKCLRDEDFQQAYAQRALGYAMQGQDILEDIYRDIAPVLPLDTQEAL